MSGAGKDKHEYFFEETLPGQLIGTACASAVPFLLLVMLGVMG